MTEPVPSAPGYALTRFNALNHGVLSRHAVLPWEDADEYRDLVAALVAEHTPTGPTEEHLVEELAGIVWRKRRLRLAEAAAHRSRLEHRLSPFSDTAKAALAHLGSDAEGENVAEAVAATDAETAETLAEVDVTSAIAARAIELLAAGETAAYGAALALLPEETREWWAETLGPNAKARDRDSKRYAATPASLQWFLEDELVPWLTKYRAQLENRPLIREQAFGEAADTPALERLGRYEVHLDRKLERMLAMLFRLKELRQPKAEES